MTIRSCMVSCCPAILWTKYRYTIYSNRMGSILYCVWVYNTQLNGSLTIDTCTVRHCSYPTLCFSLTYSGIGCSINDNITWWQWWFLMAEIRLQATPTEDLSNFTLLQVWKKTSKANRLILYGWEADKCTILDSMKATYQDKGTTPGCRLTSSTSFFL